MCSLHVLCCVTCQLRDQFYDVRKQMQQASKWKEAITGEPYALEFLSKMALEMDIRQELWKYVEVSAHAIQDWKNQLFSKVREKNLNELTHISLKAVDI